VCICVGLCTCTCLYVPTASCRSWGFWRDEVRRECMRVNLCGLVYMYMLVRAYCLVPWLRLRKGWDQTWVYACVYVWACVHVRIYMLVCVRACCLGTCVCSYICTCLWVYVPAAWARVRVHIHVHACVCTCLCCLVSQLRLLRRRKNLSMCRFGQIHVYTVSIRFFWQGIHQIYGHIQCLYIYKSGQPYVGVCMCVCINVRVHVPASCSD